LTSIAYALSALGFSTDVDDIFYVTRLPIAKVFDDGMTLAETYDTCKQYLTGAKLPLSVEMKCFDHPSMTLDVFVKEIETAVNDQDDIHILNFNVQIAHDVPQIGDGHFSLLADYDPKTGEVVIADSNPKKYTRYWRCPVKRMYDACRDKDSASTRPRGMLVIRKSRASAPVDQGNGAAGKSGKSRS